MMTDPIKDGLNKDRHFRPLKKAVNLMVHSLLYFLINTYGLKLPAKNY